MVRLAALIFALLSLFAVIELSKKPVTLRGITVPNARTDIIQLIESEMVDGKYRFHPKGELAPNIFVHEYTSPAGNGYQIFEEEMRADGLYRRSYGLGGEAIERTFNWKLVEPIATST